MSIKFEILGYLMYCARRWANPSRSKIITGSKPKIMKFLAIFVNRNWTIQVFNFLFIRKKKKKMQFFKIVTELKLEKRNFWQFRRIPTQLKKKKLFKNLFLKTVTVTKIPQNCNRKSKYELLYNNSLISDCASFL